MAIYLSRAKIKRNDEKTIKVFRRQGDNNIKGENKLNDEKNN